MDLLGSVVERLDVDHARREVEPFVRHPESLEIWSREFVLDVISKIELVEDTAMEENNR